MQASRNFLIKRGIKLPWNDLRNIMTACLEDKFQIPVIVLSMTFPGNATPRFIELLNYQHVVPLLSQECCNR
jgi:hypothetical protein